MIIPSQATIDEILTNSQHKYSVPKYQRNFDWGKSELQELVDDLKEVAHSPKAQLFLGNFIFDTRVHDSFEVVDGQQRLTTLSLTIIAIREHAKRINEEVYAGGMQKYISMSSSWSDQQGLRFNVSPSIRDIFEHISNVEWDGEFPSTINGAGVKRQVNKVKPIYDFIKTELSTYNIEKLREFTRAVMTAYVVVINVESDQDVFSIFERTNARGLDLNIGDLLKNYIFAHGVDEFEDQWSDIVTKANGSLPRMLKYYWVSENGYVQQSELYRELRRQADIIGVHEFVSRLSHFADFFDAITSADEDKIRSWLHQGGYTDISSNQDAYEAVIRVFQALKLFRVTQSHPAIFSIFEYYKRTEGNKNKLLKVLQTIEKYHFVNNTIVGRIGNDVEKFYSEQAKYLSEQDNGFNGEIDRFANGLQQKKASRNEFISAMVENVVYDKKNIAIINYIFDRINNYGSQGSQIVKIYFPDATVTRRNFNIEHILPQSYKKSEDPAYDKIDTIGNLIVISRHSNSEFQDKSPLEKKAIIEKDTKHRSHLVDTLLDDYGPDFASWNVETIEKRSAQLAADAYDVIWKF